MPRRADSEWPPIGENGQEGWKLLANRSPSVFIEFHERASDSGAPVWDDPADGASITGYRMWHETTLLPRLTRFHLAVGYGVITLIVGAQADLSWVVWISLALLAAVVAAVAVLSFAPARLHALSVYASTVSAIWVVVAYVAAWTATPAANPYAAHVVTFWVGAVFVLLAVAVLTTREVLAAGALALAGQIGTILGIIVGYLITVGLRHHRRQQVQPAGEWVGVGGRRPLLRDCVPRADRVVAHDPQRRRLSPPGRGGRTRSRARALPRVGTSCRPTRQIGS